MRRKGQIIATCWNGIARLHSHVLGSYELFNNIWLDHGGSWVQSHVAFGFFRVFVSPRIYVIPYCCCFSNSSPKTPPFSCTFKETEQPEYQC